MKIPIKYMGISILYVLFSAQAGCISEKIVLNCSDGMHPFIVTVKAEKAPFSDDPNTYWYLRVPDISYSSGQISNLLVFWLEGERAGFICEDIDGNKILISPADNYKTKRIEAPSDFNVENSHLLSNRDIAVNILSEKHIIQNVQCAYFHWNSGGIYYWGYGSIEKGLASAFGKMKTTGSNNRKSGFVPFVKWNPNIKDWPQKGGAQKKKKGPLS